MPKSPEKPTSAVRPRTADVSPTRPAPKPTFLCFFCKSEFHSRSELINHQDCCESVPLDLRFKAFSRTKSSQDERRPDNQKSQTVKPSCEKLTVPSPERRRTRSENMDESVLSGGDASACVESTKRDAAKSSESGGQSKSVEGVKTRDSNRNPELKSRDPSKNVEPVKTRESAKSLEVKRVETMKSRENSIKGNEPMKTRDAAKSQVVVNNGSVKCSESIKTRDGGMQVVTRSMEGTESRKGPSVKIGLKDETDSGTELTKQSTKDSVDSEKPRKPRPRLYTPKPGPKSSKDHAVRRALLGKPLVSKERFVDSLYLVPVTKVKDIEEEQVKHHNEIIEIDLTDESDALPPKSPRTPCTPSQKLLLSFDTSQSQTKPDENSSSSSSDSDDDSKAKSSSNHHHHYHNIPNSRTLLSIALTSNLGMKLSHLVEDVVERSNRDRNYEHYCKTPIKNSFQDRLRYREMPSVPITFRKNKHFRSYYHMYKFTKKQREEFMSTVTTGLNRRSRKLYRSLPKSSVKLKRLNHWDIKRLSKIKSRTTIRPFSVADQFKNRQPNILRRLPSKFSPAHVTAKSALAAALLKAPPRVEGGVLSSDQVTPVGMVMNVYAQQQQLQQQMQQRQFRQYPPRFVWAQPNPNRAVAQVSPIMKPTAATNKPATSTGAATRAAAQSLKDKMREEKIDDDISIVLPADECLVLSSDDDTPRRKRHLNSVSILSPKSARMCATPAQNKSYSTSLLNLPSPTKRVISAAAKNEPVDARTFLFRCHLCGLEERHNVAQTKDIYRHLHSTHRGEVIHIVDYKLHGQVHLVEAMSKPPTVMKTAPEVARYGDETNKAGPSAAGRRSARNVQSAATAVKPKPDMVICIDE